MTVVAAVARSTRVRPLSAADLLAEAVARAGLWERLAERAHGEPGTVAVLLAPGASGYGDPATAVDAALVEHLIDLLHDRGYRDVTVGAARCGPDTWLAGPGLPETCRRLGYTGRTPQGNAYRVVDLAEDVEPAGFPDSSVLHGSGMARGWLEAGFRINIAKNSTHRSSATRCAWPTCSACSRRTTSTTTTAPGATVPRSSWTCCAPTRRTSTSSTPW